MRTPYQLKRYLAFLNPWENPLGIGFQTVQSLLTIGSGGLIGVGLGQSKQKFSYLPQQYTDFIFSISCLALEIWTLDPFAFSLSQSTYQSFEAHFLSACLQLL